MRSEITTTGERERGETPQVKTMGKMVKNCKKRFKKKKLKPKYLKLKKVIGTKKRKKIKQ